jgi:hypothetical protein
VKRAKFDFTVPTTVYNESLAAVVLRPTLGGVDALVARTTHANANNETI